MNFKKQLNKEFDKIIPTQSERLKNTKITIVQEKSSPKFNFKKIPELNKDKLLKAIKADKKATSDNIVFILPTDYSTVQEFSLNEDEIFTDK